MNNKMCTFKIGFAVLAASLLVHEPASAQEPPAALVKAAQAEGEMMFYGAIEEGQIKLLASAFEKKYGIKSSHLRLVSGQLVQRFVTENDGNGNQADVFLDSSPVAFRMHSNLFMPITAEKAPNVGTWPAKWRIGDRGITIQTSPMVVQYNTDLVKPNDVPKTWKQLADPKWKGKVLLTDSRTSETYLGWLNAMEKNLGPDYVKQIAALNFTLTPSGASGAQMVAAGAQALNFPAYASFSIALKEKKAPIESQIVGEPQVVSQSSVGVAAKARHPNAAWLFLNFLLSEEGIKLACANYPVSTPGDFAGKLGCIPLNDPQLVEYGISEERKQALLQLLGLTNR
jgi:iron(III) transport system substrate-binding protein